VTTTTPVPPGPAPEPTAPDAPDASAPTSKAPVTRRKRVVRRVVGGTVLLAALALTAVLPEPRTTSEPLAPDSTAGNGSRAVAQILGRQGVQVEHVSRLDDAAELARPGTTLLVTSHALLYEEHVDRLAGTGADLVLVDPDYLVERYAPNITSAFSWGASPTPHAAQCTDPDAMAAGTLTWASSGFEAIGSGVTLCFPDDEGGAGLAVTTTGGRYVAALATSLPLTNDALDQDGNAALALRLLGRNPELVWYTPDAGDLMGVSSGSPQASASDLVPGWAGLVAIQLAILALFVALWRGRRLGPLVAEPLPVVVQSSEVTRGRGRLYRRSRSYGHAAAALRAASAHRCAQRLGLPRSAGAEAVIDEVAYASGRARDDVALLLYGPPPTHDAGLTDLARELDRLESEVNRP